MSVFAIDGSFFDLPATKEIREYFDPNSGLQNPGKGHYPQCLVCTLFDVFRRIPVARTVNSIKSSEREEMKELIPYVPSNSVLILDRGYPSYESFLFLNENFDGFYLFRCPSKCTFPAVENFIKSEKIDDIIHIDPTNKYIDKVGSNQSKDLKPIEMRVVRMENPDGTTSVLLSNMVNKNEIETNEILDLFSQRWRIEEYYRDEKVVMNIEQFHSKSKNGILQELYSAMIMSVISRTMMMLSSVHILSGEQETQFKNALITMSLNAAFLVPDNPEKAVDIFKSVLSSNLLV